MHRLAVRLTDLRYWRRHRRACRSSADYLARLFAADDARHREKVIDVAAYERVRDTAPRRATAR